MLSTPPAFILSQDQTLMLKCLFPLRTHFWLFTFLKSKGSFRTVISHSFLLFLRSSETCFALFLEWKFIEFSGLFHCLIINVPKRNQDSAAIGFAVLPTKYFHFVYATLTSDSFILTQLIFFVKHFLKVFSKSFLNCFKHSLISNSLLILPQCLWFVNT